MSIPASLVKDLRDRTGAGMMDCKQALEDANGDLDDAQKLLREKGIAAAGKRAGRKTTEGRVAASTTGSHATLVAVGSETEPVSSNDEFLGFARRVLTAVEEGGPEAAAGLEDERVEMVARLGENITIVGAERYELADGGSVATYVHPPANKIGVLVAVDGGDQGLARHLAMHIAFANPQYTTRDDVPAEEIDAERDTLASLPEVVSKPEDIRPKIVEGMLSKRFFGESVLVDQPWIHDDSMTVGKALGKARVRRFARLALG
ncbi:MAG: translation elongation factor Ts [Gaiellales bacterium]